MGNDHNQTRRCLHPKAYRKSRNTAPCRITEPPSTATSVPRCSTVPFTLRGQTLHTMSARTINSAKPAFCSFGWRNMPGGERDGSATEACRRRAAWAVKQRHAAGYVSLVAMHTPRLLGVASRPQSCQSHGDRKVLAPTALARARSAIARPRRVIPGWPRVSVRRYPLVHWGCGVAARRTLRRRGINCVPPAVCVCEHDLAGLLHQQAAGLPPRPPPRRYVLIILICHKPSCVT